MTSERLNKLIVLTLSKAAQLVYAEAVDEAYSFLSKADRFFRFAASSDRMVLLTEEISNALALPVLDPSVDLSVDASLLGLEPAEGRVKEGLADLPCLFVERMSLIDTVMERAEACGETVVVSPASGSPPFAISVSCGASTRVIGCT